MKVTVIPTVIVELGTIPKGLVKGLEDYEIRRQAEIIQNATLLRLTGIMRRILETWGDLLSLKLQQKTISHQKINHLMYMDDIKLFAKN